MESDVDTSNQPDNLCDPKNMDRVHKVKRKRKHSGTTTLSAEEITRNLQRYGETVLHCAVHISKNIRDSENGSVLKCICALLNSGGGILHMQNLDYDTRVQPKDMDTWWSAMENKMADIISGDDICNYFDMIGNYDDKDLYLFVKTAEHLCTLDYYCRLPTDTATHEVSYHSAMKLLTATGEPSDLCDLPHIPTEYHYGQTHESLKQETKQIQFKQLSAPSSRDGKSLPSKIKYTVTRYLSAFANHEGGHIYFGIEDVKAAVLGEELSEEEQQRTVDLMVAKMQPVIWGNTEFQPIRGKHWNIQFFPVNDSPRVMGRRMVIVVSVCKFPGGVFTSVPESYYINDYGGVEKWSFQLWKQALRSSHRDKPELHNRFVKLALNVPQAPLVFTLQRTVEAITDKLLQRSKTEWLQPRHALDVISDPRKKEFVRDTLEQYRDMDSICIVVNCWGLQVTLPPPKCVLCDVLIISETRGCQLLTFTEVVNCRTREYSSSVAAFLKSRMVLHGGCTDKFGVTCQVLHIIEKCNHSGSACSRNLETSDDEDLYPSHFNMNAHKYGNLIRSLIVCMAAYKPVDFTTLAAGNREEVLANMSYFFLLTSDQFDLLWSQQFTKELWIHGPPGSGKTVAAVQLIQELRRRGSGQHEILYLAENDMLCSYVRSFNICKVCTRRNFLKKIQKVENKHDTSKKAFSYISNVIIDEAQNFKARDGDWYKLTNELTKQHRVGDLKDKTVPAGYFWVFMDYSQKVHKFEAGLPSIVGKNNFMLSEVSRNSKEIFDYAMNFMTPKEKLIANDQVQGLKMGESLPKLGHDYSSGRNVDIVSCSSSEVNDAVVKVLSSVLGTGVDIKDIAILVGRRQDKEVMTPSVKNLVERSGVKDSVTIDTVKGFSGMDRSAIIGVNPRVNEDHADFSKYLLSLATRARDSLVIITPSDKNQEKLSCNTSEYL
ncbi:schlafen family member 13-like [Mizuhopecten yessoensis]|uniref:Schlafen family member 11 n=1 Tax=Mizuhopecten yessoensis TaxID=6573 RepID=A0A210QI63_MIZYE|nr:schlafen family member 13-like [Mizuhopecten yessoensis]OWF48453.1 Schlafen family member 11 [Mizuhopecten yessoensis]